MVSITIPNYNSAHLLRKNLPKLFELLDKSKLDHEVIVVDDASTDDSVKYLQSQNPKLRLISNDKNQGFASTADKGIRSARGEIVFTMKTDAIPEKSDYFKLLLNHFRNPKVFAVGAALKTIERGKEEIRGQGVIIFHRGFFLHFRTYQDYRNWLLTMRSTKNQATVGSESKMQNTKYSAWPDGGSSAFRKSLYLKIGGFDKLYNPFYWEDVDLGYRAWKAGYQIDFECQAALLHNYESGAISKHYTQKQIETISQRNQFIFVWKNGDLSHLTSYFRWEIYHYLVSLKNGHWTFFQAYFQACLLWPQILFARIQQKGINVLSDDQVLAKFQR